MTDRWRNLLSERSALLPFQLESSDLLWRDAPGGLDQPGRHSANRHCGLFAASDGWIAINLARPDDVELVPALTGCSGEPWGCLVEAAAKSRSGAFLSRALELQLPTAALGEALPARLVQAPARKTRLRVLDLSVLWAGPLCAGLLGRAGAEVRRVENRARPDPTPTHSPRLDQWLNGGKMRLSLDLSTLEGRQHLREEIDQADVVVASARAGACAGLGLHNALLHGRPNLIWVAITAHGWAANRVGFGDDCAVAGGLVRWADGEPRFMGDALADPLTGLEAALAVLVASAEGRSGLLDLSMAGIAAAYMEASA